MKKWYDEDWHFTIAVVAVGKQNTAEECRLGFEPGDMFECTYECPAGFCPLTLYKVFPVLEVMRGGGDLRNFGSSNPHEAMLMCPDNVVCFRVSGQQVSSG